MLAAAAALLLAAVAATPPQLALDIESGTAAFTVSLDGELWLQGRAPSASWGSGAAGRALALQKTGRRRGAHPTLGGFNETRFFWTAPDGVPVETAFQQFDDALLLEQAFPKGLAACNRSDPPGSSRPVLAFPDFGSGGREEQLGAITWTSTFSELATHPDGNHEANKVNAHNAVQLSALPNAALGRPNGGPVVAFDEQQGYKSLVISPFDNFLASTTFVEVPVGPALCGKGGLVGACEAKAGTDVTSPPGSVKTDVDHIKNLTRAECCSHCSANPKCEAWARPPGDLEDCWLVANVAGTEPSPTREVGCPHRSAEAAAAPVSGSWWQHGISAEVSSLPAGFTHSTILRAGAGITDALQNWGATIKKAKSTTRNPDIALSHLSYCMSRDCFCLPRCCI